MHIDPKRLREIRVRKGLTRAALKERSQVSERQLARLERTTASRHKVRDYTMNQIADALGTKPEILSGEAPLPAEKEKGKHEKIRITALMDTQTRLFFALIKRRYGVSPRNVINMAPLFFVLLAEQSLLWRKKKLGEIGEATERLRDLAEGAGHLSFVNATWRCDDAADEEDRSISKADLFGRRLGEDIFNLGYDPSKNNPFADYLRKMAAEIDNKNTIEVDPYGDELDWADFPYFRVCNGDLERIACGSEKAKKALEGGHVRIADIPGELWEDGAEEKRKEWLESNLPEAEYLPDMDLTELFDSVAEDDAEEAKL